MATSTIENETSPEVEYRITYLAQITTILAVIFPFVGLVAAAILLWPSGFHWTTLGVFVGTYLLTGLGITVGYHRLFTHRSFETNRFVEGVLAIMGSMAFLGPLFNWVAVHRRHHQHSDKPGDPHSPHTHGHTVWGVIRGFWHAHMGWFLSTKAIDLSRYIKDLRQSRFLRCINGLFLLWVLLGLAIPTLFGWWLIGGWTGALLGFLWGGPVRIFIQHHVTWSINSICHWWGKQPYKNVDHSKNNAVFGVLALGEGWHNNHHAFPTSARHGLRWWQIDISYYFIKLLTWFRLAKNVKVPSASLIEQSKVDLKPSKLEEAKHEIAV